MNRTDNSERILSGPLLKIIAIVVFPIIVTNFIDGIYGIIDSLFIAKIGSLEVAVVTFTSPIQDTFNAIGVGLTIAGSSLIATYIGMGKQKKVKSIIMQLLILGIGIGLGIVAIGMIFSKQILLRASITENLLPLANNYFKFVILSIPLNFISLIYLAVKRAEGNTKESMKINLYGLAVKLISTYVLLFIFNFGINGVGIATILSKGFCAIISIKELFFNKHTSSLVLNEIEVKFKTMRRILLVALPLIMEKSLISFGFIIVNKYILEFGESVLSAYGITNKINSVLFKSTSAFGMALAVMVAQNLGANQMDRVKKSIQITLALAVSFALVSVSLLLPFKYQIAGFFVPTDDPTFTHIINAMSIYTLSIIPWAITEVVMGIFQGSGQTKYNLIVSLIRIYIFRVPTVIILSLPIWGLNEFSIWYAMLISNILSALFSLTLYIIKKEKLGMI